MTQALPRAQVIPASGALLDRVFELARWNRKPPPRQSFNYWWLFRPATAARAIHIAEDKTTRERCETT